MSAEEEEEPERQGREWGLSPCSLRSLRSLLVYHPTSPRTRRGLPRRRPYPMLQVSKARSLDRLRALSRRQVPSQVLQRVLYAWIPMSVMWRTLWLLPERVQYVLPASQHSATTDPSMHRSGLRQYDCEGQAVWRVLRTGSPVRPSSLKAYPFQILFLLCSGHHGNCEVFKQKHT